MGPPHWMLVRPDFSDRDAYERQGWAKVEKKDLEYRNGHRYFVAVGATVPENKIATITIYYNYDSGLYARVINFFDQGDAYMDWSQEDLSGPDAKLGLEGAALLVNNRWVVKKFDERFTWNFESRVTPGKVIIVRAILEFYKIVGKKKVIVCQAIVNRDEE